MFKLVVEAEISSTEDSEKVLATLKNILPEAHPEIHETEMRAFGRVEGNSAGELIRLHALLRRERILDAARRSLFAGLSNEGLEFGLNKQVAYVGRISFCDSDDESPLGSIHFSIECSDPSRLVEWLAPKTVHGRPMQEMPMPIFNP